MLKQCIVINLLFLCLIYLDGAFTVSEGQVDCGQILKEKNGDETSSNSPAKRYCTATYLISKARQISEDIQFDLPVLNGKVLSKQNKWPFRSSPAARNTKLAAREIKRREMLFDYAVGFHQLIYVAFCYAYPPALKDLWHAQFTHKSLTLLDDETFYFTGLVKKLSLPFENASEKYEALWYSISPQKRAIILAILNGDHKYLSLKVTSCQVQFK